MTFGFYSAVETVVDSLDRLHTTAKSHKRVMVLEVMGRHAGWIALYGGIGGSADIILLPEIPFTFENVAWAVRQREAAGQQSVLVVVAEGAAPKDGGLVTRSSDGTCEARLGGIGEIVAAEIGRLTGKETRACTLGHLQRGGAPTGLDRILGVRFGVKAVDLIRENQFGQMVSYQHYQVGSVPIADAVGTLRLVDPESEVVAAARGVGVSFGDE
jgi:6-phosphofructokinase 1